MIVIEVGNIRSQILGPLTVATLGKLNAKLSYELPGAEFAQLHNPWAGTKYLFSKITQSFPTGLIHYVENILTKEGIQYQVLDKRSPIPLGPPITVHNLKLYEFQLDAVKKAIERQRGIIKVGTGGGKTCIAIEIIAKLNVPTLILIHKTDVFWQLIHRLEESFKIPIGRIGDGDLDIQRITVGMIQTISQAFTLKNFQPKHQVIRQFVESCNCLITDECHHCPAKSFLDVHKRAKNTLFKFGLSASPWREDNADLLIEAYHAKQIVDISASWLIDHGYLVPPVLYRYKFKHERKPRSNFEYPKIYDTEVVYNIERNKVIVESALKAAKVGKTVLIAITKIEHGRILETMLQTVDPEALFVFGESESEQRKRTLKELNERKRKIVICTTIFGEGIDVPNLDVLVNAKAGGSSVDAFQLIGRVLRRGEQKSKAYIIDIADEQCKYLGAHSNSRLKIYKTEPRYEIQEIISVEDLKF